eukprot:4152378-Heterocapsa_arctica.AAC.1
MTRLDGDVQPNIQGGIGYPDGCSGAEEQSRQGPQSAGGGGGGAGSPAEELEQQQQRQQQQLGGA